MNQNAINRLNNRLDTVPLKGIMLSLVAVSIVRTFLEVFSDLFSPAFPQYIHYLLFYLVTIPAIILIFWLFLRKDMIRIVKLVSIGFIVVMLPPILDLIISGGKGFDIGYIQPQSWADLFHQYLTFWNGLATRYATPGIKIEILIIMLFSGWYIGTVKRSLLLGVLSAFLIYTVMFCLSAFPYLMWQLYNLLGIKISAGPRGFIVSFLLVFIPLFAALAMAWNKKRALTFLRDIPLMRVTHFLLMPLVGVLIHFSLYKKCGICGGGIENFILLLFSVFSACIYSLISNNIADVSIDKINNPDKSLFSGWDPELYRRIGNVFLIISLVLSAIIPFTSSFYILVFLSGYYLYSQPPFRLKRVPVFSKIIIAFNTWALVLAGFTFGGRSPLDFPGKYTWLFLLCFGLALNFIDLKDYKGDKAAGIKTLPVLLGEEKGRLVIGLLMLAGYVTAGLLINYLGVLIVCFLGGIITFIIIMKIRKADPWILTTYLISLVAVLLIVKWAQPGILKLSVIG